MQSVFLLATLCGLVAVAAGLHFDGPRPRRMRARGGPNPQQPQNPIVAYFTNPLSECGPVPTSLANANVTSCVLRLSVQWMQSGGIRVVPLRWDDPWEKKLWLLERVNGVFYPGGILSGGSPAKYEAYFAKVLEVWDYVVQRNDAGDPFFWWGICQGFQMTCACAARDLSVVEGFYSGMDPLMMPVNFTAAAATSNLYRKLPAELREVMATKNSTLNWHELIVKPSLWTQRRAVRDRLEILSTNLVPNNGTEFVSSVEGKNGLNVFAVQFHPERPPYEFDDDGIGHNPGDVAVSAYHAILAAERARLNNHSFATAAEADALMVENYPSEYQGWGVVQYWITN